MQINSRILAETYFSRELAIKKLLKALINEETEPVREPEVYNLTA
jgi:hypothetical protein